MALKIHFVNGTEVPYLSAIETEEYWNGASRRTVTFDIEREAVSLDNLDALCTEENCAKLELVNEDKDVTNILDGYVLKLKLAVEPVLVDAEKQQYADRIKLKLGKRTYIEEQLHALGLA